MLYFRNLAAHMVPAHVLRPRAAFLRLLALALAPRLADATVDAFNCTRAGTQPFQLLKATDDDYYSLKKLANGVYVDIYELDYTDANDINAAAMYTDADGNFYPYAVFDSQLCRFDKYSVHCYDGTMGVDLANAAAIVGGDQRPTGAHRFERIAASIVEGEALSARRDANPRPKRERRAPQATTSTTATRSARTRATASGTRRTSTPMIPPSTTSRCP